MTTQSSTTPTARPRLSWVLPMYALAPTALTWLGVSTPGGDDGSLVLAGALWIVLGLLWARAVWRDRHAEPRRWLSRSVVPALFAVGVGVAAAGLPLDARFEMSRPAFERLAVAPPGPDDLVGAGLYRVCCWKATDFGYQFGVGDGILIIWGFAYSPNGAPPGPDIDVGLITHLQEGDQAYRHLTGPWYIWEFKYS